MSVGRILIVDDEESITALLRGWIDTSGFEIESASNGLEALQVAKDTSPDAVVMDASMPVMGGFEALLEMQKDAFLRDIPVIFLTVRNDVQDIVNALDSGAMDYLTKPFKPQILLARLRTAVRQKRERDSLKQAGKTANMQCQALRQWADCLDIGMLLVDREGLILMANKYACQVLGRLQVDVEEHSAQRILHLPEDLCPWITGESFDYSGEFCGSDGPHQVSIYGRAQSDYYAFTLRSVSGN